MIPARKNRMVERAFLHYNRYYIQQRFHRVRLEGRLSDLKGDGETPLLVCMNHTSWWDLLFGLFVNDLAGGWDSYGPMDERQLERYRFFSKLGVIGVDRSCLRGAREFVEYAAGLLEGRPNALWITPQGEFTSNSVRPVHFQPGIGAIAQRLHSFYITTVVFDFEFWSENRPEAFISMRPLEKMSGGIDNPAFDRRALVHTMERRMERHLDELTALRVQRDASKFTTLLEGRSGISLLYDTVRTAGGLLRGRQGAASHEEVKTPGWRESRR